MATCIIKNCDKRCYKLEHCTTHYFDNYRELVLSNGNISDRLKQRIARTPKNKKRSILNSIEEFDMVEYQKEYRAIYYQENKEKIKQQSKKYREENPTKNTRYQSKYRKQNPEKANSYQAKRYSDKLQQTPKWLSKEHKKEIESIYKQAVEISNSTGIKHEVDHIIPLKGKDVKGLHVPWNLRVIPRSLNRKKSNKF